ncbi:MAG: dephospho-CoA kinase [Eubacteriales bacterium]|nr:dephospho-CoA kinase [Eubacteriales bacterium]
MRQNRITETGIGEIGITETKGAEVSRAANGRQERAAAGGTRIIGVTGGVGSGKSSVLDYLAEHYRCRVIKADEAAHIVEFPGGACYEPIRELLESCGERSGDGSAPWLNPDGTFNGSGMAALLFRSPGLLEKVNALVHPAVKEYLLEEIRAEREKGELDYLFIEAALLIENGFLQIVDEMWYIYCQKEQRIRRLEESRGYTRQKAQAIMDAQLSEEAFREACDTVIDNSGPQEETFRQIDAHLREGRRGAVLTE